MKRLLGASSVVLLFLFSGCGNQETKISNSAVMNSSSVKSTVGNSSTTSSTKEAITKDISGTFYSANGETAEVKEVSPNKWEISYQTSEGLTTGSFETKWQEDNQVYYSKAPMEKSDGYKGFNMDISYVDSNDITLKMSNGNPEYQLIFTKDKPKQDETYAGILTGDLSSFSGQLTTEQLNQSIADSGFTMGGYKPEDYYQNKTTVFPAITENGYWNGITSHGNYVVEADDLPTLTNGYYQVNVHGTNFGAGAYDENNPKSRMVTFYLVPPNIKAPDGTTTSEKRVFQEGYNGQIMEQQYLKDNWWEDYQN